jgi:uncharacterized protein
MKIEYDTAKNEINIAKHGVSLAEADDIEWDSCVSWLDMRHDYGEQRMTGMGYIGNRIYVVVFVDRDNKRRIISLRKANKREVERYAKT